MRSIAPTTGQPTTNTPTIAPTTQQPTMIPTTLPTTQQPTKVPTIAPTTHQPSELPTTLPTTEQPSSNPTVKPNYIIVTVAGTGSWDFSGDNGAATSAMVSGPCGVALDVSGAYIIIIFVFNFT